MNLKEILKKQNDYFLSEENYSIENRIDILKLFRKTIKENEKEILDSLQKDIGKTQYEGFLTEYQVATGELDYMIKNLYNLLELDDRGTSLEIFPGKGYVMRKPYGQVLVLSPWNYPFQLSIVPVIGAIATGNTVILKTSSKVPNTNSVIEKIIKQLPEEIVYFGNEFSHDELLDEKYDFYFFTGSLRIGKKIYSKAAENMVPIVLELGGKSPCIVDETANIKDAAKKIAWGKFLNSGQTCVAPDYILVDKKVKKELIDALTLEINTNYNDSNNLANIITKDKVSQLSKFIENRDDIIGGEFNIENRVFMPTLLTNAKTDDEIMQSEIFGPILPILEYENISEIIDYLQNKPSPLAMYLFSKDKKTINLLLRRLKYGNSCINDLVVHVSENSIPFGGMGNSGLGNYHGKYSIETFTHGAGIIKSGTKFTNPFRYPPYTEKKFKMIKKLLG